MMGWKRQLLMTFVASILVGSASGASAQVTFHAKEGKGPLTVGVGLSDFSLDWGNGNPRQEGTTLWVDWRLPQMPSVLRGLGIEMEGRDLNLNNAPGLGIRHDTLLGGPIYEWQHPKRIWPYAKYVMGIGSIDFKNTSDPSYQHDTRAVFAPAAGVDVLAWNRFSVRGEYEYQFWHQIFGPHDLNPQGFTIGVVYDFRHATH